MFTGIVAGVATILELTRLDGLNRLEVQFPFLPADLKVGDSIALDGTCLTVTAFRQHASGASGPALDHGSVASFDVMRETLSVTTLNELEPGSIVNFEPAARFGDQIGGHAVAGHIHCRARVSARELRENNLRLCLEVPEPWRKYLFPKGYVTVSGASLTVGALAPSGFAVDLIPETCRLTHFAQRQVGDYLNLEIDTQTLVIVDTIERVLPAILAQQAVVQPSD